MSTIFWSSSSSQICYVIVFFLLKFCVVHFLSCSPELRDATDDGGDGDQYDGDHVDGDHVDGDHDDGDHADGQHDDGVVATKALLIDSLLGMRCGGYDGGHSCIMF